MSPTQAREIIEAAAERIAEWKSRLRVNTGRGVESWNNKTGQMVSVRVSGREMVKEPVVFTNFLWANITHFKSWDPSYIPKETISGRPIPDGGQLLRRGGVETLETGWFVFSTLGNLTSGEYDDEDRYLHSDDLLDSETFPGYFNLRYSGHRIAPLSPDYLSRDPPAKEPIPTGARYLPERIGLGMHYRDSYYVYPHSGEMFGWISQNSTNTTVTVRLAVRGYSPDYLDDIARRNLPVDFEKGQGVGAFDLLLRQEDSILGPAFSTPPYVDEYGNDMPGGLSYSSNPLLSTRRVRVSRAPTTTRFISRPIDSYYVSESPGIIELMAYRKV